MLSGFIEATIEITGGERKADCRGVAATIHVVGRGQDGFVGADGKANFGFRLGPDAYDATLTLTYGPYTAGFCRPPAPVVIRIPALDDGIVNAEKGEFASRSAAAAKINERCPSYGGVAVHSSDRGEYEIWTIRCFTRNEAKVEKALEGPVYKMTGWILK